MVVVSWTADNPGRRLWRDDEICERDKVLIPEQRQRIITLEAQIASYKRREVSGRNVGTVFSDLWDMPLCDYVFGWLDRWVAS